MSSKLYLVDSFALAFRSYYAFINNPLKNNKGQYTSVLYGYCNHLFRLVSECPLSHLAIVTDLPGKTFRHEMYKEYKAHRPPMPEEMKEQLEYLNEFLGLSGIPVLSREGFEADDVMASLAVQAAEKDMETYLVSKDKDLMQLVNDKIFLFHMEKAGKPNVLGNREHVIEKMGVPPEQVRDLLALMGDSADNVPGVPKVGAKTACKLLAEYGSIDGIYENLDNITAKALNKNLTENKELAELSRDLVTLDTSLKVLDDLEELRFDGFADAAVQNFLEEYELFSLTKTFKKCQDLKPVEEEAVDEEPDYVLVQDEKVLKDLAKKLKKVDLISLDTETDSLDSQIANLVGICLAYDNDTGYYVPIAHKDSVNLNKDVVLDALGPVFSDTKKKLIFHNAKYDLPILKRFGFELSPQVIDTMVASYLINPGAREHSLDAQVDIRLKHKMISIETLIGKGKDQISFGDITSEEAYKYGAEDGVYTYRLWGKLESELKDKELESVFYDIELPLMHVLLKMEERGITLDTEHLSRLSDELHSKSEKLQEEIFKLAGVEFNVASPKQLSEILFEKMQLPHGKKTKTGYSTNASILEKLKNYPIVNAILQFRECEKLKNTYVDVLPGQVSKVTGRLHTSYNQVIAATGRLSSINPNLQNIPIKTDYGKEVRKAFIAQDEDHVILSADYSQIELRVLAHLSDDPGLKKAYNDGVDIHAQTAAALYDFDVDKVTPEMRRQAKAINFGVLYGMSAFRLSNDLGITRIDAQNFIDGYFDAYPNVTDFINETVNDGRTNGYVASMTGRKRYIPELDDDNGNVRNGAERIAVNSPIQGTAADIIKIAMINLDKKLDESSLDIKMLLQVHDELVFEVHQKDLDKAKKIIQEEMENALSLTVPLSVEMDSGKNWLEAH